MKMSARLLAWTAAVAATAMLGGCATHDHGAHAAQASGAGPGMSCPMHAEMQQKMAAAKTPEERRALMAGHHQGMGGMGGMGGMSGAGGMSCPMMQPGSK